MAGTDLNEKLKEAQAAAEKMRSDVATVERRIAEAQAVVSGAAERRKVHALAAAVGDQIAAAAISKIRKECAIAEQDLADLQAALPEARRRAAIAEKALASAQADIGRAQMQRAILERIGLAREIDRLSADLDIAWRRFLNLGGDLEEAHLNVMAARGYAHSMTNIDAVRGLQRIIDAMPPMTRTLFPSELRLPKQRTPLALAEAAFWGVNPDDDKDGAAAA